MNDYRNVTFDELAPGATVSVERALTRAEVEALVLVTGEVEPCRDGAACVDSVGAFALVSSLVERGLPGQGSRIVAQQLEFAGRIHAGEALVARLTVLEKRAGRGEAVLEAEVRAAGERRLSGTLVVAVPTERLEYSGLATSEVHLRRHDVFAKLLARCEPLEPVSCAVVHACDADSLMGALEAAKRRLIVPVLVGPEARIRAVAAAQGADLAGLRIVATEHSHASAEAAVALARAGEVETLMKGSLHTDELMHAVVAAGTGLRTARRVSHVFVMDVPAYDRMLLVTDAAINIDPSLADKADIVRNAIDLAHALGIEVPRVAILSAVETVSPALPSTLDAAALCKMADRGQITGAVLDGPLAFDNAVSEHAARAKGIDSPVAGRADVLLVPDLESGNMLAKQLQYFAGADSAGIVVGARVPVALTSRADNVRMRIGSAAVAKLRAHRRRAATAPAAGPAT